MFRLMTRITQLAHLAPVSHTINRDIPPLNRSNFLPMNNNNFNHDNIIVVYCTNRSNLDSLLMSYGKTALPVSKSRFLPGSKVTRESSPNPGPSGFGPIIRPQNRTGAHTRPRDLTHTSRRGRTRSLVRRIANLINSRSALVPVTATAKSR